MDPSEHGPRKYSSPFVYKKPNYRRLVLIWVCVFFGIVFGFGLGRLLWHVWQPVQHHLLYDTESEQIAAQWTSDPIVVPADYEQALMNASYYDTDVWKNMSVEHKEDGSWVFTAMSKDAFQSFVAAIRAECEDLVDGYVKDASTGFSDASFGMDYHEVTIHTPMKQPDLIDQDAAKVLLQQMKLQSLFYDGNGGVQVQAVFVNESDGTTVLVMKL